MTAPYDNPDDPAVRAKFESLNSDSYGFRRSRFGNYVNPAIGRDWKWFQLGFIHRNES